ncbi:MAG: methyl-accepting chemotaxis protein [Gammaproteobacteria bacterium]|nr:methyl-accepting chemotaxis protein [Gammaproteobacteria bacterium]MBU1732303.1 methyl-accepting chemotaxis protein [Gammaproteobacteria bacterium]MBU1893873.1 methyl-accepting chemotaxis protein [Gammaproteobacteria bacterium]
MFSSLMIKTRLTLLVTLLSVLLVAVGVLGLAGMNASNQGLKTVYEDRTIPLMDLGTIIDKINIIRLNAVVAANASNQDVVKNSVSQTQQLDKEIETIWAKYMATTLTVEEKKLADAFAPQWKTYQESRNVTLNAAEAGDFEAAIGNAKNDAGPKYSLAHDTMFHLIELQGAVAKEEFEKAESNYSFIRNIAVIAIVGGLMLGLGLAIWIIRSITVPLGEMRATITLIERDKDFTRRVEVDSQDEVGQTAKSFNQLVEAVRETLRSVSENVSQVSDSVGGLASSSSQVATSSAQQSEAASAMAASVEQMTVSINHVSDSAKDALSISRQSGTLSAQGGEVIHRTVDEMNQIAGTVRQASAAIDNLGQKSDQITSVVQVIKEVADQTNLLALNAAIEAARAGEQGRGFAVVADEVRKLAERTTKATEEIAAMVNSMQESARSAVSTMDDAVERVGSGAALAQQAGDAINQIKSGADQVVNVVNDISAALAEQSVASNDIAGHVERVAQMTEENSAAAGETASSAEHLHHLSVEMRSAVSRFKI